MSLEVFINEHWVYKESTTLPMVIYEYREYNGYPVPVTHEHVRELLFEKGYIVASENKIIPKPKVKPRL